MIPPDYQLRALDFGRQNLDATGISSKILDPRVAQGSQRNTESYTKYFLKIESIEFFAGMAMGPRADDAKFVLDLREYFFYCFLFYFIIILYLHPWVCVQVPHDSLQHSNLADEPWAYLSVQPFGEHCQRDCGFSKRQGG